MEVLQERLTRQARGHRVEGLMLEEGKVAVLNVSGPLIFSRQKIAALTMVEYLKVAKVGPGDIHLSCPRAER